MTDQKAPRRNGRPPLTNRAAVLAAAYRIGYPDLTIRAVTAAVKVKYSTFYRHYASLELLVTEMVDGHLTQVDDIPTSLPGREHLTALGESLTRLVAAHPGIDKAMLALPERPARLHDLMVTAAGVLMAHNVDANDAYTVVRAVVDQATLPRPALPADDPFGLPIGRRVLATVGGLPELAP